MRPCNGETRGIKPTLTGRIYYDNTYVAFTDRDIEAKSFSMQTGTSVPGSLSVGAAVMGSIRFTLINRNGKFDNVNWKGSKFSFLITTVNGNIINDFNMGTYFIANHTETGDRIQIECYDAFKLMDETPIWEDIQDYGLFPAGGQNMGDIVNCVVTAVNARYNANLTTSGLAYPNQGVWKPANVQMSERQLISYIAQLCGQYVIIRVDSNGYPVLKFDWYHTSNAFDAGTTFSHTLRTNDITVTGVKVSSYSGETTVELGNATGSQIVVETNPLIRDAVDVNTFANQIWNSVQNLTFRPGTASIRGTPAFEAGDYIKVATLNEDNVYTIITNLTYTFELTIDVTADAPPYEGDLALIRSRYIREAAKQAVSEELGDSTSELSEAIAGAGGGTVVHFPTVVMDCTDSSHWSAPEAPNQASGGSLGRSSRLYIQANNAVRTDLDSNGYDFRRIRWDSCDALIPAYDANNNRYFDITLYLYSYSMSSGVFPGFDAYDSVNDLIYVYPLHARARYVDANTLIFDQQWVWGPVGGWGNVLGAGVLIPLPSKQFDIANSQWIMPTGTASAGETYYAPVTYP